MSGIHLVATLYSIRFQCLLETILLNSLYLGVRVHGGGACQLYSQ